MMQKLSHVNVILESLCLRRFQNSSFAFLSPFSNNKQNDDRFKLFQNRVQFKCVYQQMGYEAPLSMDDRKLILEKLNHLSSDELSKFLSKPRSEVLISRRPFGVVEELLDIKVILL